MRNFILLLRRYNFFIVFLLLQVASFTLLIRNNTYQRASVVSTSNNVVGKIYSAYSNVTDYLKLGVTNKMLAEENARLRKADSSSFYDTGFNLIKVSDTIGMQQYEYITARVVNNSINKVNNYLTLEKGRLQGIEPDMAVISSSGVVGIVQNVSEHYSTVRSLLHSGTKVSSKIKKNEYFGSAVWNGDSPRHGSLLDIPSHAPLAVGDTIVTTSFSIYPRGVMVGTVSSLGKSGESFKEIKIRFSTDFQNLSYVYVVRNYLKLEKDTLEAKAIVNDR